MNDALLSLLTLLAVARTIVLDDGVTWTLTATGEATAIGPWRADAGGGRVRGIRIVRVTALDVTTFWHNESERGGRRLRNVSSTGHNRAECEAAIGVWTRA